MATTQVLDILFLKAAEQSSLSDLYKASSKAPGFHKAYKGVQAEDSTLAIYINVWDSVSQYTQALDNLPSIALKAQTRVLLGPAWAKAVAAPVTEVVFFKLQNTIHRETLAQLVPKLLAELNEAKGSHLSSIAISVDDQDFYAGVVGWDSVQAHWDAVAIDPLGETVRKIKEVAEIELKHWELAEITAV